MRGWGVAAVALVLGCTRAALGAEPPFEGRSAFQVYAEEDGLTNLTVEAILQDHAGALWVGTQDGLFRFDGVRFQRFGRGEGLPGARVNVVHETRDGRLYVGTRGGLARVDGARIVPLGAASGVPEELIPDEGIASDAEGDVFVATQSALYEGNDDHFRLIAGKDGQEPRFGALHVDASGALIFARGTRLMRLAHGVAAPIPWGDAPITEPIEETATDRDGRLWARTMRALYVRAPGASAFVRDDAGLPAGVSAGRLALADGADLVVPTERGLARQVDGTWRLLGRREGLPAETTQAALVDREGSLWIGLAGDGLARRVGTGELTTWTVDDGLSHAVVWSIVREHGPHGGLWVGTQSGLDRIDADTGAVRVWTEKDGLAGDLVYALAAADDGSVWAGSWPGGVTRIGPEAGRVRRYSAEGARASDFRVHAVQIAKNGDVWVGAATGAWKLAGGAGDSFVHVPVPDGPRPGERDNVLALVEDAAGTLWGAGKYGIQRLNGAAPRRFRKADGLRDDYVASLVLRADGSLLAGYREAEAADVVRIDGDHLTATRVASARSDKVLFVGVDAGGSSWLGTAGGVRVLHTDGSSRLLTRADGLPTEDMDQNAFFADADGTAWLGSSRGLVHARLHASPSAPAAPPVAITSAWAGERRLDLRSAPRPSLERRERSVRVTWEGLTFADPKKVRYRYRLRGLDDAFVETDSREARFPALAKGEYRFEVVAISAAGKESDAPATLAFEVRPAWWERGWSYAAFALGFLGLAWGAAQARVLGLRRRAANLEALVKERTRELDERVGELARANADLLASNARADRIFSALAEALPGTVIEGKYRLEERIGHGGFGVVFRAVHLEMRRDVAVKVFRPSPGNDSADALERFRREAQAASRIDHPNAIVIYDSGMSGDGIAYMAMELLNGPSLSEARQSGMLTVERCLDTLARVCDALDAAHETGIIHRDVKPENVLLHHAKDGSTVVKVVDFGIATLMFDEGAQRLTKTHALLGTPGFIAPERLAGEPYDGRSDVYAVGVMAYELFVARVPFGSENTNALDGILRRLHETAPSMRTVDESIPADLDAIVMTALCRNPSDRPTARELSLRFEELRAALPDDYLERAVASINADADVTVALGRRDRANAPTQSTPRTTG